MSLYSPHFDFICAVSTFFSKCVWWKTPSLIFFPCGWPSYSLLAHHNDNFFFLMPQSFLIHLMSTDHSSLTGDLPYSEISICEMTKNRSTPPSCTTSGRQSKVWHMVPFHAWQESIREAHHCYCQIWPGVYSSITPSSLTVTSHHALYINSGCDIDLFPPSFSAQMHPVSTSFQKERLFSYFLHNFYSRPYKLCNLSTLSCWTRGFSVSWSEAVGSEGTSSYPKIECESQHFTVFATEGRLFDLSQRETRQKDPTPPDTRAQSNSVQRDWNKAFYFPEGGWVQFSSHPHQRPARSMKRNRWQRLYP